MSKLSKETIDKIQHDANSISDKKLEELKKAFNPDYEKLLRFIEGYHSGVVAGATEWAGKVNQSLIDLLDEARLQIEYLHKKFKETGSGNNVLARIETELAKYKEVRNG